MRLDSDGETQIRILDALARNYGIEVDLVATLGGKNGMYAGDRRVVVAADALEGAYLQVGVHEMVHYAKRMGGDSYALLESTVLDHLGRNDLFDLEEAIEARMAEYARAGQELTREAAIEEIVAEAAPTALGDERALRTLVDRDRTLAEKVRDFFVSFARRLRQIALNYAAESDHMEIGAITDNAEALMDIAYALDDALEASRTGTAGAEGDAVKYSRGLSFAEQLRRLKAGTFSENDHLYVMDTPEVLQGVGLQNLPVLITQRHAKSVMKVSGPDNSANYHGLTINMMRQLPEAIADPIMVIKSKGYNNRITVITNLKNDSGETIIAPIEMDGRGVWENVEIDANILTTAYGKNRLKEMLLDAAMNDEVLFAEKERSRELAHTLGVQFPDTMASGGFIHSISDYATESNPAESKYSVNPLARFENPNDRRDEEIQRAAARIVREYRTDAERSQVVDLLAEAEKAYEEGREEDAEKAAGQAARLIVERSRKTDTSHRAGYEEIRKRLRTEGLSLTQTQQQEAANEYGSYNDYRKAMMGSVKIKNEGTSLDALWGEMSEQHPEYLPLGLRPLYQFRASGFMARL